MQSAQAKHNFMLQTQLADDEADHWHVEGAFLLLHWWLDISVVAGAVFYSMRNV
jgi:hypothetical protein